MDRTRGREFWWEHRGLAYTQLIMCLDRFYEDACEEADAVAEQARRRAEHDPQNALIVIAHPFPPANDQEVASLERIVRAARGFGR
jgi:DNA-binding ferritin-like protein